MKEAAWINYIVTIAKLVPLGFFLLLIIFFFKWDVFVGNLTGGYDVPGGESLFAQVQGTMLITVFVFLGIEGASVYSRYAEAPRGRRRSHGAGFPVGAGPVRVDLHPVLRHSARGQLAGLMQPSVGGVLESVVGPWGGAFIRVGLIVSVLGAYLAWQLLAADVVYAAARNKDMPSYFAEVNAHDVPKNAVLWTSILDAGPTASRAVREQRARLHPRPHRRRSRCCPFALASGYAFKIALRRGRYEGRRRGTRKP